MELINSQIDKIEDMLERMYEVIESSRAVPFSTKVSVDKESLFGVMDDIRGVIYDMKKGLPSEINQARRVLSDKDAHLSDARSKAEMMIKAAQTEADRRLNEHEITQQARKLAAEMQEEANREVDEFKTSAGVYVRGVLDDLDEFLHKAMESQLDRINDMENFYVGLLQELRDNKNSIRVDE
ncbi:MAG: hypothetical protein FWE33_05925 [Defluviitaleaceae bacterium]|nr:hypothetical protein [Defluviitaleaceae bacterium]